MQSQSKKPGKAYTTNMICRKYRLKAALAGGKKESSR